MNRELAERLTRELRAGLPAPVPTTNGLSSAGAVSLVIRDAPPPAEKLDALLENDDLFRRSWERARSFPSQSEYDQSLANIAAVAGWTDQEIWAASGRSR